MRTGETLPMRSSGCSHSLGIADATAAFPAIVAASPGGLGEAPEHDVREPARVTLREAMAAAADRDSIASEYATGYAIVFGTGLPLLSGALRGGAPTLEAIVSLHLGLLAEHRDTLIERKAGLDGGTGRQRRRSRVLDGKLSIGGLRRVAAQRRSPAEPGDDRRPGRRDPARGVAVGMELP